jgi:hypothetical protein
MSTSTLRTWDDNREMANELWPLMNLQPAERDLWHDDLSGLDQVILYDAMRNVKRNNESLYPQLKWIRDEYRSLHRLSQFASRKTATGEPREIVKIDADANRRYRDDLRIVIDDASPSQFQDIVDMIADKAGEKKVEMATAYGLVRYAIERLGMGGGNVLGGAA